MNAIKATWTNGQILRAESVNWPEGSELLVEPIRSSAKIGMDENEWRNDAQSIAEWIAWVDTIEGLYVIVAMSPGNEGPNSHRDADENHSHNHVPGGVKQRAETQRRLGGGACAPLLPVRVPGDGTGRVSVWWSMFVSGSWENSLRRWVNIVLESCAGPPWSPRAVPASACGRHSQLWSRSMWKSRRPSLWLFPAK